jgi:hypothetical protein
MLPVFSTSRRSVATGRPLLAATGSNGLDTHPFLVGQIRWVALGRPGNLGHPAARRCGPHQKLESGRAAPFNTVI